MIGSLAARVGATNLADVAGGFVVYLALTRAANLEPATISAVAGSAVAAGLSSECWSGSRTWGSTRSAQE